MITIEGKAMGRGGTRSRRRVATQGGGDIIPGSNAAIGLE